jgi:hypothetical protein
MGCFQFPNIARDCAEIMERLCFLGAMFPCAQRVYAAISARYDAENRQTKAFAVLRADLGKLSVAECGLPGANSGSAFDGIASVPLGHTSGLCLTIREDANPVLAQPLGIVHSLICSLDEPGHTR